MSNYNGDKIIRFNQKVTAKITHFDEVTRENVKEENFTFYTGNMLTGTFSEENSYTVDFDYRDVPLTIFNLSKRNFDIFE